MDLYLPSTEPGLTLQEMIDCDIKCGVDFSEGPESMMTSSDLNSLDLSGMSSLEAELDLKSFEPLFDPLENMDAAEDHSAEELNVVNSWMNMSSMSNCSLDLENSVMVNPSAVLPTGLPSSNTSSSISSSGRREAALPPQQQPQTIFVKTEAQQAITTTSVQTPPPRAASGTVTTQVTVVRPQARPNQGPQASPSQPQQGPGRQGAAPSQMVVQTQQQQQRSNAATAASTPVITARATSTPHAILNNRYKSTGKPRKDLRPEERVFPKPAYSYSCLIALALKNSTTGSLPVSEIYSFMCEHFPYFRTAPNGWKNSVRHNLSLNKCFEKIEKPVVAGNNQRKGCLWALNPAKAHKMDEEVQKWSKKDLQGIKDAMAYPEVLEALERGEMKFESNGGVSSCSEDEDEDEEVDPLSVDPPNTPTVGTVKILNPLTSPTIVTPNQRGVVRQALQNGRAAHPAGLVQSSSNANSSSSSSAHVHGGRAALAAHALRRNSVSSSSEETAEYILPDSTMTEISLQSNGALVDDLGNEIKIEGESPVHATSSSSSSSSSCPSPRGGLVVRKLPGVVAPLRSAAAVRANYVYAPTISSPHQQHTLNRLVLTNGKLS